MATKKRRTPRALLDAKEDKLNWSLFHFLENLLVFCALPTRSVPAESGVRFQISSQIKSDGICILFKIDRGYDPLVPHKEIKPDYSNTQRLPVLTRPRGKALLPRA